MSAFLVSKAHIDAIVTVWISFGYDGGNRLDRKAAADKVGAMLWSANLANTNALYPRDVDPVLDSIVTGYRFEAVPLPAPALVPVRLLKLLACYAYQCCDRDAWTGSEAERFVESLRSEAIHRLPGYDACPWGLDDASDFAR